MCDWLRRREFTQKPDHFQFLTESKKSKSGGMSQISRWSKNTASIDMYINSYWNKHNAELQRADPGTKVEG